jgi:hypothetical protein
MLAFSGVAIASAGTPDGALVPKLGTVVASELGGRPLLRYLMAHQAGQFLNGSDCPHYVTPTPFSPREVVSYLAVPALHVERAFVMLLDPSKIKTILGPRQVWLGKGIEYILPNGFPAEAILTGRPIKIE